LIEPSAEIECGLQRADNGYDRRQPKAQVNDCIHSRWFVETKYLSSFLKSGVVYHPGVRWWL